MWRWALLPCTNIVSLIYKTSYVFSVNSCYIRLVTSISWRRHHSWNHVNSWECGSSHVRFLWFFIDVLLAPGFSRDLGRKVPWQRMRGAWLVARAFYGSWCPVSCPNLVRCPGLACNSSFRKWRNFKREVKYLRKSWELSKKMLLERYAYCDNYYALLTQ